MSSNSARPSEYSQFLRSFGLHSAARRAEDPGFNRGWGYRSGKTETEFVPFDSMLRTVPEHAQKLAEEQYTRFLPMESMVWDCFATIEFAIRLHDDPRDGHGKGFIWWTRKKLPHNCISKVVVRDGWLVLKILSFDLLPDEQVMANAKAELDKLGLGIRYTWKTRAPSQFQQQLRKLVASELPKDDDLSRAKLECILKGVHQVVVHSKLCRDNCDKTAHKFDGKSIGDDYRPPKKSALPPRRMNAETGERAYRVVPMFALSRKIEDLDSSDWIEYPDFEEEDATSPREHAEMSAMIH